MANEFVIKNGYFSQGNSNVTGSLVVTQNVTASKALFSSSGVNQLMVLGSGSSSWLTGIYGSQGNIFTATDTMSGSLFTIADISGYPIFKVISDHYTNSIQMIGTASLTGSLSITENLAVGQNLTASKALISSSGNEQLMVLGSGSDSWLTGIYGSQGNLLTVTDTMSGSLFTVADISGYPVLKVISDHYTNNVQIVGDTSLTGSLSITQNLTASKALISSSGNEQLMVLGSGSDSWLTGIYGSQGNLLTVTDTFSGSIFTVSDISGYPILDITSDYYTNSVYLPTLTTDPQQYVVTYNSESGQLFYSSPSSVNGGAGGPNLSVQFNSASILTGSGAIYIQNDGPTSLYYDHLHLDNAWLTIRDSSNNITFTSDGLTLGDTDGYASLEWDTRILYDSAGTQSIQYDTRQLTYPHDPSLVPLIAIDWGTANQVTISGSIYTPNLTNVSQVNAVVVDTASGQLYYLPTSSIGGGGGGPGTTINNNVNDYIITATGTPNTLNGEANLQFNGSTLTVTGNITATSITGSLTGSLIGSLTGTASWAQSASQAVTASYVIGSIFTGTNLALSASNALTASYVANALVTASISNNIITFTKGNGSTFPISVASGGTQIAAKYMGVGTNITGSIVTSASYNLYIPANTFTVGDVIRINCLFEKPTGGSNSAAYFYITGSTTEFSTSVAGATQLARYNPTNTLRSWNISRLLFISSSTNTEVFSTTTGNITNDEAHTQAAGSTGGIASLNINWTQDQWIVFAHTNATLAELTRVYRCIATKV